MPGPPPKPTQLKILQGNPGGRSLNQKEPKPTGIPTCPKHLDAGAKREWKRVSAELIKLGLLTTVDMAALAAYCCAYSRWAAAETNIARFGAVIKSPKSGYPIQNPYVGIANTSLDIMRRFALEFGLTPASRSRIQVSSGSQAGSTDAFESFMASIGATDLGTDDNVTQLQPESSQVRPESS